MSLSLLIRRTVLLVWFHALAGALGALVFVNPAPKFEGDAVDFATNPVHPVGSGFKVEWTSDDVPKAALSLLLFQNNSPAEDAEHVFRNVTFPNKKASWQWTVVTNQTLDHSNVFGFSLFFEGKQNPEAISREFNITASKQQWRRRQQCELRIYHVNLDDDDTKQQQRSQRRTETRPRHRPGRRDPAVRTTGVRLLPPMASREASTVYSSGDKYGAYGHDNMENQQQPQQEMAPMGELQATPLCEVETPPDDSAVQRQRRGPAELGGYEGVELQT
ncbi:hypothetical protein PG997_011423 [Apiospora hydei]|uniref:Reelin domain-containing protein n=1 Tax=Apiospora hydei TaxID=1337664 RepID=A0ABR1VJ27_9PEZI